MYIDYLNAIQQLTKDLPLICNCIDKINEPIKELDDFIRE